MSHAEKCPVCNSTGKVNGYECYGCQGWGWITVNDGDVPTTIPYRYYEYPWVYPSHCPYTNVIWF